MQKNKLRLIKAICLALVVVVVSVTGRAFYQHRNYKETVVLGPGVTEVKKLGDYFAPIAGTVNDSNVYIIDSGEPGGTVMIIGRSHPEEVVSNLTTQLIVENAVPVAGKVIVVISANRSASTVTRPGEAYPQYYDIQTDWGTKTFRMGCRWTNPLDSWPDPEVYVHYPSGQLLAYADIRNQNRTWPGRADGTITEQTNYAFTKLISDESVDLLIDLHGAELEYSVNNCIVTHETGREIAVMAAMMLSEFEFEHLLGIEYSPRALHGLSHREVGDHTDAVSLLFESATPILDRIRGITDEKLLLEGNDPFVKTAGKYGLLYVPVPEEGWHIDVRVGRHLSAFLEVLDQWTSINSTRPIVVSKLPRYAETKENGIGHYFQDPDLASKDRIRFE